MRKDWKRTELEKGQWEEEKKRKWDIVWSDYQCIIITKEEESLDLGNY